MCVYCNCGDQFFRHDPPWNPQEYPPWPPQVPAPVNPAPVTPWPLEKLLDYYDLMKRVKDLEDRLGCPCEPNKADYLDLLKKRIEALEKKAAEPKNPEPKIVNTGGNNYEVR